MSPPMISKAAARYTGAGGKEHCSLCRHFSPRRGGRCARVLGDISPRGWCRLFSREMRGLVADASSFNGGAGGPTLGLDFMTPGVMDPRITFTRASTATYFNSAGVMQTAAVNAPRWDYDPATLALRGLLIEEARTNLWLQSADASNAAWLKSGSVAVAPAVTGNQTAAPDGTITAARIVYPAITGAGALSVLAQAVVVSSNPQTFSVWLRGNAGGESVYLMATADAVTYYRATATLTTAWQRFILTTPTLVAGQFYWQIGADLRDAGQAAKPAQTIYAWGAQVEAGAFATSYIPTTSAAVTRAAEQCYIPTASWYSAQAYSLMAEFDTPLATRAVAGISDAVFANASYLTNSAMVRSSSAVGVPAITVGTAVNKQCGTVDAAVTVRCCNNGGAVTAVATSAAAQTMATRLSVGCSPWALDNQLCGHVRRVAYWSRVLTDGEMQTVTTL